MDTVGGAPGFTGLNDTSPEADRVLCALWREAGPAKRLAAAAAMTRRAMALSRAALRRAMPGATEGAIGVAFVRLQYGEELARGVERRLREGP